MTAQQESQPPARPSLEEAILGQPSALEQFVGMADSVLSQPRLLARMNNYIAESSARQAATFSISRAVEAPAVFRTHLSGFDGQTDAFFPQGRVIHTTENEEPVDAPEMLEAHLAMMHEGFMRMFAEQMDPESTTERMAPIHLGMIYATLDTLTAVRQAETAQWIGQLERSVNEEHQQTAVPHEASEREYMLARYVNLQDQLTAIRELQSRQWEAHRSSSGKRVPLWMNLSRLERALLDARAIRRKLRGQVADMERDLSTGAEQDFEMAMEASTAVDETRDLRRQRDAWHLAASVLDGQVGLLLERPQQIVVIQAGSNGQKQELVPAKQHADIIVTPQQPATRESRLVQIPGLRDRLREAYAKDERFMVLDSDVIDEVLGRLLDIHLPEVTSVVYKVAADTYHSHSGDLPGKQNRYLPDGKLWKQSKPVLSDARLQEAQAEDSQITRYIQDKIVGRETAWIQDLLSGRDRHELDLEMVNRFLHVVRDMILEQYQIGKNGDPVYMGRRRTAAITMFDIPDSLTTESSIFKMRQALPVVLQLCDPAPASSQ